MSWGKHVAGGEINCSPLRTRTWRFHCGEDLEPGRMRGGEEDLTLSIICDAIVVGLLSDPSLTGCFFKLLG